MKPLWLTLLCLPLTGLAQEEEPKAEAPKDPNIVFSAGFQGEGIQAGNTPSSFEVISGTWEIVELKDGRPLAPETEVEPESKDEPKADDPKEEDPPSGLQEGAFQALGEPIVDGEVRVGPFLRDQGARITARVRSSVEGRLLPRFGLALHCPIGYRLRVVPAQGHIELQKAGGNEEPPVQTTPFEWRPDEWWFLELIVQQSGDHGAWTVEGRVWPESGERPEDAPLSYIATDGALGGKAALLATPYSGKAILFDDIEVKKIAVGD